MRALFVLPIVGLAAVCLAGDTWTRYTEPHGEFHAIFPDRSVTQEDHVLAMGSFTFRYRTYAAHGIDVTCVVTSCPIPKGVTTEEVGRFTLAISEGFRSTLGTENIRRGPGTVAGILGEYVALTQQSNQLGFWIAASQGHVYVLSYQAPKARALTVENSFFSAFQLNPPAERPSNKDRGALSRKR